MKAPGRVAVITGAARGLGRATAVRFADAGYAVVLAARSTEESPHPMFQGTVDDVQAELEREGHLAHAVGVDLADPDGPGALYDETIRRFGRCDVLVNNAAYSPVEPFLSMSPSKWKAALMVNLWGPAALSRLVLPGMVDRGSGTVINVGSGAAVENIPSTAPYCVTKAALERLTETVGAEIAGSGATVVCIRIAERIATESDLMMRSKGVSKDQAIVDSTTPAQFADVVLWAVAREDLNGRTLPLDQVRRATTSGPVTS
jgi:NAD(P)-dependent dehydrogenase (short-subunit alcohol dehydrogenase family)